MNESILILDDIILYVSPVLSVTDFRTRNCWIFQKNSFDLFTDLKLVLQNYDKTSLDNGLPISNSCRHVAESFELFNNALSISEVPQLFLHCLYNKISGSKGTYLGWLVTLVKGSLRKAMRKKREAKNVKKCSRHFDGVAVFLRRLHAN